MTVESLKQAIEQLRMQFPLYTYWAQLVQIMMEDDINSFPFSSNNSVGNLTVTRKDGEPLLATVSIKCGRYELAEAQNCFKLLFGDRVALKIVPNLDSLDEASHEIVAAIIHLITSIDDGYAAFQGDHIRVTVTAHRSGFTTEIEMLHEDLAVWQVRSGLAAFGYDSFTEVLTQRRTAILFFR